MNKKVDDKWLKNLRERMEDYTEPLPDGLWEELDGELNKPKVIPFWRRWPSVAAAVALVLIINSLTISNWFAPFFEEEDLELANRLVVDELDDLTPKGVVASSENLSQMTSGQDAVKSQLKKEIPDVRSVARADEAMYASVSESEQTAELDTEQIAAFERMAESEQMVVSEQNAESEQMVVPEQNAEPEQAAEPEQEVAEAVAAQDASGNYRTSYKAAARTRTTARTGYAMHRANRHEQGGIELGVYTGGVPYGTSEGFSGMSRLAATPASSMKEPVLMGNVNSKITPYSQVLFSNRDKYTYTEVKHHMPINVVASVKWNFAENWALESGVSYTFMQSDLHSGSELYWEDTQKLHYVGIPLKVHRNIWNTSAFAFYASAGGMIEKCVSGSLESVYVTSSSTREVENHSVSEHPFQFSLAAAVGAQVSLLKTVGLFIEPGVAYFFDDGSNLATVRKEHPFNFNLQFGLRFNLNN